MTKKEYNKRMKEEHNIVRKSKDKKERVVDLTAKPTQFAARPNLSPYAPPVIPMDYDDGIPYRGISGVTGELLEQNAHAFNQISANLAAFQVNYR